MAEKKRKLGNKEIIAVVVGLFALILGGVLVSKIFTQKEEVPITEDQIKIQKGEEIVIINRNGLVEYFTGSDVFYQTWDSSKVSNFFSSMEEKARKYLENPTSNCSGCYEVTLYLDGKLVVIYISSEDEEIDEVFEEFGSEFSDTTVSDFFDDDEDEDEEEGSVIPGTSPTPGGSANPTPTSSVGDNPPSPEDNYPPVEASCATWSQDIVEKAIISNTLCTVQD